MKSESKALYILDSLKRLQTHLEEEIKRHKDELYKIKCVKEMLIKEAEEDLNQSGDSE